MSTETTTIDSKAETRQGIRDRIIYYRQLRGVSQEDLAEHCGVHRTTIARWESKSPGAIPAEDLLLAADCLGVTIEHLLHLPMQFGSTLSELLTPKQRKNLSLPPAVLERVLENKLIDQAKYGDIAEAAAKLINVDVEILF